tara:strand:- start:32818 stop:33678 length:861 start_codon:yes stop_codon:yes gene_type:complete
MIPQNGRGAKQLYYIRNLIMIIFIKKSYRFFIRKPVEKIKINLNKRGFGKRCNICNNTFNHFNKWRGGYRALSVWQKKLDIIGGDFDNFECPYCQSTDRERHLFMYFDKLDLWNKIGGYKILHFAPEKNLRIKIEKNCPLQYVKADLYSPDITLEKIDATAISFENLTFELVICNHVLEHIPDYTSALKEIFRVLKPGGMAILQTPYSKTLTNNFEDDGINTGELKFVFFGQEDHVRVFSEKSFIQSLVEAGFILDIIKHEDLLKEVDSLYFGVSKSENLIKVIKP